MSWNRETPDWPNFTCDSAALEPLERCFLLRSGVHRRFQAYRADDQDTIRIELIGDEAVKTSEIEGEILDRDSVQSSLRHQLGLSAEKPGITPAERGIAKMMLDLYRNYADALTRQGDVRRYRMLLSSDRSFQGRLEHGELYPHHRNVPHGRHGICRTLSGRAH